MIGTRHRTTDPEKSTAGAQIQVAELPWAENETGGLLSEFDLYPEALEAYEAVIARDPANALAYIGKGNALLFLNRPAEALAAYQEAARLDPTLALAYAGQGAALRMLGRDEDALAAYDEAIRRDESFAPAYYGKGFVLLRLKHFWEALKVYRHAMSLEHGA